MARGVRDILMEHLIRLGIRPELLTELLPDRGAEWSNIQSALVGLLLHVAGTLRDRLGEAEGATPSHYMLIDVVNSFTAGAPTPLPGSFDVGVINGKIGKMEPGARGRDIEKKRRKRSLTSATQSSASAKRKLEVSFKEGEEKEEEEKEKEKEKENSEEEEILPETPPKKRKRDPETDSEGEDDGARGSAFSLSRRGTPPTLQVQW